MCCLEFADKRSEWAKYFICMLTVLGYRKLPEGNCRCRICGRGTDEIGVAFCCVGRRFYLGLLPQNEFDCRCTAGRDAVTALCTIDFDFASFFEVVIVVGDVGLEAFRIVIKNKLENNLKKNVKI